jgi:HAD superfamily hydrolase (TIGR01509 family)
MTEAVLFDCDGVLVDSETLIAEILVEMANERGGSLTLGEGLRMFHGIQLDLCAERLSAHLGSDVTGEITEEYQRRSAETFRHRLTAVAGVEELVRSLTVPTGVVTNSSWQKTTLNLTITGLVQYFTDRVYSAADLSRWKPEPDIYLHAATQLGVEPTGCVAIEDSSVGVRSAAGAGMSVIGFGPAELRASGARWTCQTMSEVADLVHNLTRGRPTLATRPAD